MVAFERFPLALKDPPKKTRYRNVLILSQISVRNIWAVAGYLLSTLTSIKSIYQRSFYAREEKPAGIIKQWLYGDQD